MKNIEKIKTLLVTTSIFLTAFVFVPQSLADEGLRVAQTQHDSMWELEDEGTECYAQSFKTVEGQIDITKVHLWLDSNDIGYCRVGISKTLTTEHEEWEVNQIMLLQFFDDDWFEFENVSCDVEEQTEYYLIIKVCTYCKTLDFGVKLYSTYNDGKIWHRYYPNDWVNYPDYDMAFKVYGNLNSGGPTTPGKPSGPGSGYTGTIYTYSTSASDPDGDQVYYKFDWGDGYDSGWVGPYNSGETGDADNSWSSPGIYYVKAMAKDEYGATSGWSTKLSVTITDAPDNYPPGTPSKPSGPSEGDLGESLTYSTSAIDPEGDQVYYKFDWGDGSYSRWVGPYNSGDTGNASYSWSSPGKYSVRARAKDGQGASYWSDPLKVTVNSYGDPKDYFVVLIMADAGGLGNIIQFQNFRHIFYTLRDYLDYSFGEPGNDGYAVLPFGDCRRPTKANMKATIEDTDKVTDEDTNILIYMSGSCYDNLFHFDVWDPNEVVSGSKIDLWLSELEYNTLTIVIEGKSAANLIPDLSGEDRIVIASTKKFANSRYLVGDLFTHSFFSALKSGCSYGRAWEKADKEMYEITTDFWASLFFEDQSPQIDDNGDAVGHGNMNKADKLPINGDGSIALLTHPTGLKDPGSDGDAFTVTSDASDLNLLSQGSGVNEQSSSNTVTSENIVTKMYQNMINNLDSTTNTNPSTTKIHTGELKITIKSIIPGIRLSDISIVAINLNTYEIYPVYLSLDGSNVYKYNNLPVGEYLVMAGMLEDTKLEETKVIIEEGEQKTHTFYFKLDSSTNLNIEPTEILVNQQNSPKLLNPINILTSKSSGFLRFLTSQPVVQDVQGSLVNK